MLFAVALVLACTERGHSVFPGGPRGYKLVVENCSIVSSFHFGQGNRLVRSNDSVLVHTQESLKEIEPADPHRHVAASVPVHTFYGLTEAAVRVKVVEVCGTGLVLRSPQKAGTPPVHGDDAVRLIEGSGPSSNRIDVVLMGDGYTAAEQGECFEDMRRLTREMFEDETFKASGMLYAYT